MEEEKIKELNGICVGDIVTINDNCRNCFSKKYYDRNFLTEHLGRKGEVVEIDQVGIFRIRYFFKSYNFWWHRLECLTLTKEGFNPKSIINSIFK